MVLGEQQALGNKQALGLVPTIAQWPEPEAAYISPQQGPRSPCQSLILVKHFSGWSEGWGPTHPSSNIVTPCPAPDRRGVIPILPKADATIIILSGLPSTSCGAHLCIFPAAIPKLFQVMVFTDHFSPGSLDRSGLSSPKSKHEERILHIISWSSYTLTSLLLDSG